jgi:hypothetical protein
VLSPSDLVGLLADPSRRQVVAALILGDDDLAGVRKRTGLSARAAGTALSRLVDAGLVIIDDDHLVLFADAFREAAGAAGRAAPAESGDEPSGVLRAFVRDGRLLRIPVARSKRLVVLEVLAQEFEPGRRYSEASVNLILGRWHADTAALRRYLVDEGFLDRSSGEYWRCGGPVTV